MLVLEYAHTATERKNGYRTAGADIVYTAVFVVGTKCRV